MNKRPREEITLKRIKRTQEILDDADDVKDGTRVRLSNALKKVYDSVNTTPENNTALKESDVISLVFSDHTRRILVRHLPPTMRTFLEEACLSNATALHGAVVTLYFPFDDDRNNRCDQDCAIEEAVEHVSKLLIERHGLKEAEFDDEICNNTRDGLMIPGTETNVDKHAMDIVNWEIAVAAMLHVPLRSSDHFDESEISLLTDENAFFSEMAINSDGYSEDMDVHVKSVFLATRVVEKLRELEEEVESMTDMPYEIEHSVDESDRFDTIPVELRAPPRLVLPLVNNNNPDVLDRVLGNWM